MSADGIKTYRIYFFNAQNRITDTAVLDCSDEKVCIERALTMLQDQRDYRAVEIWQDNHKIAHYDRQVTATGADAKATSGSTE